MKKYLIYLVIFFSLFIGINKIKALDIPTVSTEKLSRFKISIEDVKSSSQYTETNWNQLQNYINSIKENNHYILFNTYTNYILWSWSKNEDTKLFFNVYKVDPNKYAFSFKIDTSNYYIRQAYYYKNSSNGYLQNQSNVKNTSVVFSQGIPSNELTTGIYQTTTRIIETDVDIYFNGNITGSSTAHSIDGIYLLENNNTFLFENDDIIITKELNFNTTPPVYTYSDTINCENISKIKINFDIPLNQNFPIDIEFLLQYYEDIIPEPFINITDTVDNTNVNLAQNTFNKTEVGSPTLQYLYSGTYSVTMEPVNSLSIVIDVTEYNNEVYLLFSSQYNYSIEYVTTSEVESYFETINMNDKYAIYLIPKTLNQDISEAIYLNGTYNIEIRKFYNSNTNEYNVLNSYSNYTEKYLDKIYSITDLNYLIYIQNPNQYTENQNSYIKFDTRYYTYQIKENEYTQVEIVNPNTNETIRPNPIDTIENSDINKKNFLEEILDNFRNSSYLKNILNNEFVVIIGSKLGRYIMLLFTVSVVAIYIRMIKK